MLRKQCVQHALPLVQRVTNWIRPFRGNNSSAVNIYARRCASPLWLFSRRIYESQSVLYTLWKMFYRADLSRTLDFPRYQWETIFLLFSPFLCYCLFFGFESSLFSASFLDFAGRTFIHKVGKGEVGVAFWVVWDFYLKVKKDNLDDYPL